MTSIGSAFFSPQPMSHSHLRFSAHPSMASAFTAPCRLAPPQVLVISVPLSPAGACLAYFRTSQHTSPCSGLHTLCFLGLWTPHAPGCLPRGWLPPLPTHLMLASQGSVLGPYSTVLPGKHVQSHGSQHYLSADDRHTGGSSSDCLATA